MIYCIWYILAISLLCLSILQVDLRGSHMGKELAHLCPDIKRLEINISYKFVPIAQRSNL